MPVSDDLFDAVTRRLRAAALTDGAVDPTVGYALCGLGYDRDFSSGRVRTARHTARARARARVADRWSSTPSTRPSPCRPDTVLDLGATAKAWAADRVCDRHRRPSSAAASWSPSAATWRSATRPEDGFDVGIADVCGDRRGTGAGHDRLGWPRHLGNRPARTGGSATTGSTT